MAQQLQTVPPADVAALQSGDTSGFARAMFRAAGNLLPARIKGQQAQYLQLTVGALRTNPKLLAAAQQNPLSFIAAVDKCVSMGLRPDGAQAALVPYKGETQLLIMYQGWADLMTASGLTVYPPRAVYEGDDFEWDDAALGKECVRHRRASQLGNDPGRVVAAWACAEDAKGRRHYFLADAPVLATAKAASQKQDLWNKHPAAYAMKTAIRRLAKYCTTSGLLTDAHEADGAVVAGFGQGVEAPPMLLRDAETITSDGEVVPAQAQTLEERILATEDAEREASEAATAAKDA